jgi:hypothetical protein
MARLAERTHARLLAGHRARMAVLCPEAGIRRRGSPCTLCWACRTPDTMRYAARSDSRLGSGSVSVACVCIEREDRSDLECRVAAVASQYPLMELRRGARADGR